MATPTPAVVDYTRPIGVEFEMLAPVTEVKSRHEFQRAIARILTANGIPAVARAYSTAPVPRGIAACVEFDESIVPPQTYRGIDWANLEIKTKKLSGLAEFDLIVPRMVAVLRFLNCRAHVSTGLHVSLDAEDEFHENPRFLRSLLNLTWRFEPVIYGLVHPSRATCGFAAHMPDLRHLWMQAGDGNGRQRLLSRWEKRCGINIRPFLAPAYPSGRRVEFRWHEGTLDADETRRWTVLLLRLVDHAATHTCKSPRDQVTNDRPGFEKFMTALGLKSNSRAYRPVSPELVRTRRSLLRRWQRLSGKLALRPRSDLAT